MAIRFDEKGKYFSDVIPKETMPVVIQTLTHRVEGKFHVGSGIRLKEELNNPESFLAITDATVYSDSGVQLYQSNFLVVNRDQIVWVIPTAELEISRGQMEVQGELSA
jgi:hypothetical protein